MNSPIGNTQNVSQLLWLILGILLVGIVTASMTMAAMISTKILVLVFLALLGGYALILSGNIRLFVFYSMIFLAPWTIKKDFMYLGHMSGADSFDLHISDPFLLFMFVHLIRDRISGSSRSFRFPRSFYLWVALMVLGLWSVLFNAMSLPPAHEVYRMTRILLWMVILVNEVVRRKQFLHVIYALLIAAAAQAFFAYLQVIGIDFGLENYGQQSAKGMADLGASTISGERRVSRIGGLMTHPNVLGAYLAMSSAIAMGVLFSSLNKFIKTVAAIVWASFVIIIILTLSRSAWVVLAVVIFGVTILTGTNRYATARFTVLRLAVLGGCLIIGIVFSGQIISRISQSVPQGLSARWDFIEVSKKMIFDKPLFGFGLNNFTFYQAYYTKYGSANKMFEAYGKPAEWPVVHNSYLLVWAEQGTIGLILWMWFHIAVIRVGIGNFRLRDPTLHSLNVALLVGFVAIMFDHLVSFFDRLQQGILIWIFAALIVALQYWRHENEMNQNSINDLDPAFMEKSSAPQVALVHQPSSKGWLPAGSLRHLKSEDDFPKSDSEKHNQGWIISDENGAYRGFGSKNGSKD